MQAVHGVRELWTADPGFWSILWPESQEPADLRVRLACLLSRNQLHRTCGTVSRTPGGNHLWMHGARVFRYSGRLHPGARIGDGAHCWRADDTSPGSS